MVAGKHNFDVEQGATFAEKLTWKTTSKQPVNLTGYTARMQLRPTPDSQTVLFELSTENGRITLVPEAGSITLTIQDEETAIFNFPYCSYDLVLSAPDGSKVRLIEGKVIVLPGVTRA